MIRTNKISKLLKLSILALLILVCNTSTHAQNFPVGVNLQVLQPHSPAYHTFVESSMAQSNKIQLSLFLKDLITESVDVGLQIEFRGPAGTFMSDPVLINNVITINQGIPTMLSNSELSQYFYSNGLNEALINNGGFLPEGEWELCVTAYELLNQQQVSQTECYFMFLEEFDPPEIILPLDSILPSFPQNVQLSWQPLHIGNFPVRYEVSIWEKLEGFADQQIVESVLPYFTKSVDQINSVFFSIADPPLIVGQEYIMQVRIQDNVNGMMGPSIYAFKNNGYSEIHRFKYGMTIEGEDCGDPSLPEYVIDDHLETFVYWDGGEAPVYEYGNSQQSEVSGQLAVSSQQSEISSEQSTVDNQQSVVSSSGFQGFYKMYFREEGAGEDAWRSYETQEPWAPFSQYQRGKSYELYVSKVCSAEERSSDAIVIDFPMLPPERDFSCAMPPLNVDLSNEEPLAYLGIGETFMAGDFRIVVEEVEGQQGFYTGEGYFQTDLFKARIAVTFEDVFINSEFRMIDGFVETMIDPNAGNIFNLDSLLDVFSSTEEPFPVVQIPRLDSVSFNGGSVVIYPGGKTYEAPLKIVTPGGTSIISGGMVLPVIEFEPPEVISANYQADIRASDKQIYDFDDVKDELENEYKKLGSKHIPYKNVAYGGRDIVNAKISYAKGGWKVTDWDSVQIVSESGVVLEFEVLSSNEVEIRVAGLESEEQIHLMFGDECMAAFVLSPYTFTNYTVNLIPVNGVGANLNISSLQDKVNEILGKGLASTEISLKLDQSITDDAETITADKYLMTAYSPDMRRILERHQYLYEQDNKQLYLFLVDNLSDGVLGYMADGKNAGFIDVRGNEDQIVKTIAHEMGHGAFTLSHYWKQYLDEEDADVNTGKSDNLMDYGSGTELLYRQWNRMHNQRFPRPWFLGGEEQMQIGDGRFACIDILSFDTVNIGNVFVDGLQQNIELPPEAIPMSFYRADEEEVALRGVLHSFEYDSKKWMVGFEKNEESNKFLGYYYRYEDEEGAISVEKYSYTPVIQSGTKVIPTISSGSVNVVSDKYPDGETFSGTVFLCSEGNAEEEVATVGICEYAGFSDEINTTYLKEVANKLDEMIESRSSYTGAIRPKGSKLHIASVNYENAPLPKIEQNLLEEKLYLLKYHTEFEIFVIYINVSDQYTKNKSSEFAQKALELSQKRTDKTILITIPYNNDFGDFSTPCGFPGFSSNVELDFSNVGSVTSVSHYILEIFKRIPKPLNALAMVYLHDGSIFELAGKSESSITGYDYINRLNLYESYYRVQLRQALGSKPILTQTSVNDIEFYLTELDKWQSKVDTIRSQALESELLSLNGTKLKDSLVNLTDKSLLRESHASDINLARAYAEFHYQNNENSVSAILKENSNGFAFDDSEHLHEEITAHEIFYTSIDALTLMLAPTGADVIGDVAGLVYTAIFNTKAFGKYAEYSAGVIVVFALDKVAKGSVKGFQAIRQVENGKVSYQIVDKGTVVKGNEEWLLSIYAKNRNQAQAELTRVLPELDSQVEGMYKTLAANFVKVEGATVVVINQIGNDIARLAPEFLKNPNLLTKDLGEILVKAGIKRGGLLQNLSTFTKSDLEKFISDIDGKEDLVRFFGENVGGVKSWAAVKDFPDAIKLNTTNLDAIANALKQDGFDPTYFNTLLKNKLDPQKFIDDFVKKIGPNGKFLDDALETDYQKYLLRKAQQGKPPRDRSDWKEVSDYMKYDSPTARGNNFNKKAVQEGWYPYNEVHLGNGKRVDSCVKPDEELGIVGEIISRKAVDLEDVGMNTFESYLKEMESKYAPGTAINSPKYSPVLDNEVLEGQMFLELPSSNQTLSNIQEYADLAKKYKIKLRFMTE